MEGDHTAKGLKGKLATKPSGGQERRQREMLMRAARRRELDAIVVWRLDRWGRSLADLVRMADKLRTPTPKS